MIVHVYIELFVFILHCKQMCMLDIRKIADKGQFIAQRVASLSRPPSALEINDN